MQNRLPNCTVLKLDSVHSIRKYTGAFDVLFSRSDIQVVSTWSQFRLAQKAYLTYKSQLAFYSLAYIWTCRFMIFNTFTVLQNEDRRN